MHDNTKRNQTKKASEKNVVSQKRWTRSDELVETLLDNLQYRNSQTYKDSNWGLVSMYEDLQKNDGGYTVNDFGAVDAPAANREI